MDSLKDIQSRCSMNNHVLDWPQRQTSQSLDRQFQLPFVTTVELMLMKTCAGQLNHACQHMIFRLAESIELAEQHVNDAVHLRCVADDLARLTQRLKPTRRFLAGDVFL